MSLLIKLGDACSYTEYIQRLQDCGITQFQEVANFSIRLDNRHCFRVVAVTAEHILQDKTRHILEDLLKQSLPKADTEERQQLVERGMDLMIWPKDSGADLRWENYSRLVERRLLQYLLAEEVLHIDGFIRFRLPELWTGLIGAAQAVEEEYLWGREYQDFISLLQLFAQVEKPKTAILHIILQEDGDFLLLDGNQKALSPDAFCELLPLNDNEQIRNDDLLVSTALALAPAEILLHNQQAIEPPVVQLLRDIFNERLRLCPGCEICRRLLDKK